MTGSRSVFVGWVLAMVILWPAAAQEQPAERSGRHALLVGCTEYPALKRSLGDEVYERHVRLFGPANDAELLRSVLQDRLDYRPEDITLLTGWPEAVELRPTLKNILGALRRLAGTVRPGDSVVVFLAGHGVQQPDLDDDEIDGLDEVFLPADVTRFDGKKGSIPGALTDDEIGRRIRAIREAGATVWFILDCCHAGTMVRGGDAGVRYRYVEPELLGVPSGAGNRAGRPRRARRSGVDLEDLEGVTAFYAAQSFHKAPELRLPRGDDGARYHGLLTFTLCREIAAASSDMTFEELLGRVVLGYRALPFEGTVPFAEGDLRRDLAGRLRTRAPLLLRRKGDGWTLNVGSFRGIEVGTRLDVLPPGRPSGEPVGLAEVTASGLTSATCTVEFLDGVSETARSAPVLPARVTERAVGELSLPLCIVDPEGTPWPLDVLPEDIIEGCLELAPQFPPVTRPNLAEWLLVFDGTRHWLRPSLSATAESVYPVPRGRLPERLGALFRSRNLRCLASRGITPALDPRLRVGLWRVPRRGNAIRLGAGEAFTPGERGRITLQNDTGRIYDVTVLYLDALHGITVLFPPRGRTPRLTHRDRKEIELAEFDITDRPVGAEHILVAAIPRRPTDEVIDLTSLAQRPFAVRTRGGKDTTENSPFAELLEAVSFGTRLRGMRIRSRENLDPTLSLLSWETRWPVPSPPASWGSFVTRETPRTRGLRAALPSPVEGVRAPWDLDARRALEFFERDGIPDVLLAGEDAPRQIYADLDNDNLPGAGRDPGTFDAEIAVHFDDRGNVVYYDSDNDGTFDLCLVNRDADPDADEGYRLVPGKKWARLDDCPRHWLSSEHLEYLSSGEVTSVVRKISRILRLE